MTNITVSLIFFWIFSIIFDKMAIDLAKITLILTTVSFNSMPIRTSNFINIQNDSGIVKIDEGARVLWPFLWIPYFGRHFGGHLEFFIDVLSFEAFWAFTADRLCRVKAQCQWTLYCQTIICILILIWSFQYGEKSNMAAKNKHFKCKSACFFNSLSDLTTFKKLVDLYFE